MNNLTYSNFNTSHNENFYNNLENNNTFNKNYIDNLLLDTQSRKYIITKLINNNVLFAVLYKIFTLDIETITTLLLGMLIILICKLINK
tara:strand:+ start:21736 stop:22002 length:267 start_codon:yes stop_codon:yes gene_type:complete